MSLMTKVTLMIASSGQAHQREQNSAMMTKLPEGAPAGPPAPAAPTPPQPRLRHSRRLRRGYTCATRGLNDLREEGALHFEHENHPDFERVE